MMVIGVTVFTELIVVLFSFDFIDKIILLIVVEVVLVMTSDDYGVGEDCTEVV